MGSVNPHLRMGKMKAGPVVSDNGNFVIDAPFPEADMKEPKAVGRAIQKAVASADRSSPRQLLKRIKLITGVVEVGLFCDMAKAVYFGNEDGSVTAKTSDGKEERFESPSA